MPPVTSAPAVAASRSPRRAAAALTLTLGLFGAAVPPPAAAADAAPAFRTDADGPYTPAEIKVLEQVAREKAAGKTPLTPVPFPTWHQLRPGRFPPEGSGHAISGELIWQDHLERRFHLRVDRNDSQDRSHWDLAVNATLLPYGAVHYLGSYAALRDIPLGTHLHGLYFEAPPGEAEPGPRPPAPHARVTPESAFRRCLRLEDDFSRDTREGRLWHLGAIDLAAGRLTATPHRDGRAEGEARTFELPAGAVVYRGGGFAGLDVLQPGQRVRFNLTWVTLYGPGRVTDLWIDDESRRLATARQRARHHDHVRLRGLPGWVTAVDDGEEHVTVALFGNVDPALFDAISVATPPGPDGAPPSNRPGLAVARDSLMTYDPVNDRKRGDLLGVEPEPAEPGGAGRRVRLAMDMMLEGYRPGRIVALYPATWPVVALPREEQFFGRE